MMKAALSHPYGGFFYGRPAQIAISSTRYIRNPATSRPMRWVGTLGFSVRASATEDQSKEGGNGQDGGSGGGRGGWPARCGIRTLLAVRPAAPRKASPPRRWPTALLRLPRGPSRKPLIVPALGLGRPVRARTAAPFASDIHRRRRASAPALRAAMPADQRRSRRRRAPRSC